MAIAWIDSPGSQLGSGHDPIDFLITGTPAFISVRYPSGGGNEGMVATSVEEMAYRDGAFVYPFLGSTKVGSTVSLRRSGGWPNGPTVHVEEAVVPEPTQWQTLKEFDFASYPSGPTYRADTTGTGYFTQVIDGYTFKLRFALFGSGPPPMYAPAGAALQSGNGFGIAAAGRGWEGGNGQNGPYLALDPSQLPGYVAGKPHAVVAYATLSVPTNLSPTVSSFWGVGFFKTVAGAPDGNSAIVAATQISSAYARATETHVKPCILTPSLGSSAQNNDANITNTAQAVLFGTNLVLGAVRMDASTGFALWSVGNGTTLPSIESMKVSRGTDTAVDGGGPLDCGVFMNAMSYGGFASVMVIKKLRVLQMRT